MRIDVTLLGVSGNSLRWLRRLAPWSIIPLILGGLVLATVALGSMQYHGSMGQEGAYGTEPLRLVEQGMLPGTQRVPLHKVVTILPQQGWSQLTVRGSALRPTPMPLTYVAAHPGKTVFEAHRGNETWHYTIIVVSPHER